MHYNTCERCAVKRDDWSYLHQASSGPWTTLFVLKAFVFNIIRTRIISRVERGRSFQFIGICSIIPSCSPIYNSRVPQVTRPLGALDSRTNGGFGNDAA